MNRKKKHEIIAWKTKFSPFSARKTPDTWAGEKQHFCGTYNWRDYDHGPRTTESITEETTELAAARFAVTMAWLIHR